MSADDVRGQYETTSEARDELYKALMACVGCCQRSDDPAAVALAQNVRVAVAMMGLEVGELEAMFDDVTGS